MVDDVTAAQPRTRLAPYVDLLSFFFGFVAPQKTYKNEQS